MVIITRHQLMNINYLLILLFSFIVTMASGDLTDIQEVKDMATANTLFTFDLLRQSGQEMKGENFFFAPFSITTALGMTCMGARDQTAQEMKQVLKWSPEVPAKGFGSYLSLLKKAASEQTPGYILVGAQRIYVDGKMSLTHDFNSLTQQHFLSQAETSDFSGNPDGEREKINRWVADQTRAKIRDLLPQGTIDGLTAMVLVQALYFKGNWMHKFDATRTRPAKFIAPQGEIMVNMMEQTKNFNYFVSEQLDCAAVELPYVSNNPDAKTHDLSMLILLPNAQHGLDKLEASLNLAALEEIRSRMHSVRVNLKLPRFSVESTFPLKQALIRLGMEQAFSEDKANFTGMAAGPQGKLLYISDVFHKAVLEVNEEGSEAAAATAVVMMRRSLPITYPFIADHPFLLFITDKRGEIILFSGRVTSPTSVSLLKQEL